MCTSFGAVLANPEVIPSSGRLWRAFCGLRQLTRTLAPASCSPNPQVAGSFVAAAALSPQFARAAIDAVHYLELLVMRQRGTATVHVVARSTPP